MKNAYLQGKATNREVFMEPPNERKKEGVIWKRHKAVYGLNDAGRKWYFRVEQVLRSLGYLKSLYGHCLFSYRVNGKLNGVILLLVDNIFYVGQPWSSSRGRA